jgi:uncharacterized protein (TIGR03435 family)
MILRTVALCWLVPAVVFSQAAPSPADSKPAFEVASIKRFTGTFGLGTIAELVPRVLPGGVLRAGNTRLIDLIKFAYDVTDRSVVDGPAWMRDDFFSIDARAANEVARSEMKMMLRSLLAQRFALEVHTAQRDSII